MLWQFHVPFLDISSHVRWIMLKTACGKYFGTNWSTNFSTVCGKQSSLYYIVITHT